MVRVLPAPVAVTEDNSQVDKGPETGRGMDTKLRGVIPTGERGCTVFWKTSLFL